MSIFSYLFENNRHQATFSTLPVVVGSSRLHENQIKVRFFRPGRLASGEKSKRRIYLQQEPSSGSAQDTSWAKTRLGGLDYVWGLKPHQAQPWLRLCTGGHFSSTVVVTCSRCDR